MDSANNHTLAEPFASIFADWNEAEWAFDLLLDTAKQLGVHGPYDPRFALTLTRRVGKPGLHLNFGPWLALGFQSGQQVEIILLTEQIAWDERFAGLPSERKEGEPEIRSYQLPLTMVKPLTSALQTAYVATLATVAAKFQHWQRATHWKQHRPEIIEALFDPAKRAELLAGGLDEPDLVYERQLTAFYQDVSETPEGYGAEGEEGALDTEKKATTPEKSPQKEDDMNLQPETIEDLNFQPIDEPDSDETEEITEDEDKYPVTPAYPLSELVEKTGFAEVDLAQWVRAIERKGQAILYGPPGTGKTYLAEQLARHLSGGGNGFYDLVQFHPAYAYEDFIQGIRPQSEGEQLAYPLVPGRFLAFCRRAAGRDTCVLIIDEINRADLARVFGELMYALEYRERDIPLAGGGRFKIPANVRLLGTMNTADRSIALVDHALRRRFAFLKLTPQYELLRRYHQKTGFPVEDLIAVLQDLNRSIEENYQVGVTFFLHENLAEEIEGVWRMEIEPYLEEYFFDQPDRVEQFRWEKVGREISP